MIVLFQSTLSRRRSLKKNHSSEGAWTLAMTIKVERDGRQGKLVVSINGRPVKIDQKKAALLACLYDSLGYAISHEQLSEAIGCASRSVDARHHTLRQHVRGLRNILISNGDKYVITVARAVGYAMCQRNRPDQPAEAEQVDLLVTLPRN
jgi:DNA-binding response OmpR family regulator